MAVCATSARADVGIGVSPAFTVDTRYGFSTGATASGLFILDTRLSGSWASGVSGNFTVDTRGGAVANSSISGWVIAASGAALADVDVEASQGGLRLAFAVTDGNGYYQLPLLAAGTYDLRAIRADWLTGMQSGVSLASNQALEQNFRLEPRPPPPVVENTVREPEPEQEPIRNVPTSDQLKLFVSGSFQSGQPLDRSKMTIILTHGWNSNPDVWARDMAAAMANAGIDANIVAWDWSDGATAPLNFEPASIASATPLQGEALGITLYNTLGSDYSRPIHFIGHSLGTLVNAAAANYLHGDSKTKPAARWSPTRTHMTMLDEAQIASGGFVKVVPDRSAWIDNYYSWSGVWRSAAVNISLRQGRFRYVADVLRHGYPAEWYSQTILSPDIALLGHRFSFERMGEQASFPPIAGSTFQQNWPGGEFDLEPVVSVRNLADATAENINAFASRTYRGTVKAVNGTVKVVGNVASKIAETTVRTIEGAAATGFGFARDAVNAFSISLKLKTGPGGGGALQPQMLAGTDSGGNTPAYAWFSVDVPADAATLSFDFALEGDGKEDYVAAGIDGANVFALEARFIPENETLNSGPIDVSQYAGQTVELFFGVMGGTSTDASLTVEGIRFYSIVPPALAIATQGGQAVVSWPMWATNYVLDAAAAVGPAEDWQAVEGAPALLGFENVVTNAVDQTSRFYRLRQSE